MPKKYMGQYNNDDSKIGQREKDIAYFNSLNAAIAYCGNRNDTKFQDVLVLRDNFYQAWVEWKNGADERTKKANLCPHELCPKCGKKVKKIDAGVSKTSGKPYDTFWACSAGKGKCDWTWNADDEERAKKSDAEDMLLQERIQEDFSKKHLI